MCASRNNINAVIKYILVFFNHSVCQKDLGSKFSQFPDLKIYNEVKSSGSIFSSLSTGKLVTGDSCVLVQGLHPLKDSAFVVFEGESFRETLLTSSVVVKCDGLAFAAFPGCFTRCFTLTSQFLSPRPAKMTIHAMRCCHLLSFFLLFWVRKDTWEEG